MPGGEWPAGGARVVWRRTTRRPPVVVSGRSRRRWSSGWCL